MTKKVLWGVFVSLAVLVSLYPLVYVIVDRSFGLLNTKPIWLLNNFYWNTGFYLHIFGGGLALMTGWIQFIPSLRMHKPDIHKGLGKLYAMAAVISSVSGIIIAFWATGGPVASSGFILLGIVWLFTTCAGWYNIRNKKIKLHQKMMIYSYAACFAAVTLRIWLPFLSLITQDFTTAYRWVAWLCWIPNLIAAHIIISTSAQIQSH